ADLRSLLGSVTEAEGLADLTEVEPLAEILPLLREPGEAGQLSIDLTATVPQQPGDRIRMPAEVGVELVGGEGRQCLGCLGGALDEVAENCVGSHGAHCALRHRSCHGAAATVAAQAGLRLCRACGVSVGGGHSGRGRRRLRLICERRCSAQTRRRRELREGFVAFLRTGGARASRSSWARRIRASCRFFSWERCVSDATVSTVPDSLGASRMSTRSR